MLIIPVAANESNEDGGASGGNDEVSSSIDGSGDMRDSDIPAAVDLSAVSDEAVLEWAEEIRDGIYLCCACVMFSGGAVAGLLTVRGFWSV